MDSLACVVTLGMAYADLDKKRANSLQWQAANRDKVRASNKKWFDTNRSKRQASIKGWSDGNKDKRRSRYYQRTYGITLEKYQDMLKDQGGVCYICRRAPGKRILAIDHNHLNSEVRKLLCNQCNVGLGNFDEVPGRLRAAAEYLESHDTDYVDYSI